MLHVYATPMAGMQLPSNEMFKKAQAMKHELKHELRVECIPTVFINSAGYRQPSYLVPLEEHGKLCRLFDLADRYHCGDLLVTDEPRNLRVVGAHTEEDVNFLVMDEPALILSFDDFSVEGVMHRYAHRPTGQCTSVANSFMQLASYYGEEARLSNMLGGYYEPEQI